MKAMQSVPNSQGETDSGLRLFFVPVSGEHNLRSKIMIKKYEIPEMSRGADLLDEDFSAAYDAARKHAKQLNKAGYDLEVARDLTETLRGYLCETHIGECFTAGTIVELIEKLICKARERLDRHETTHNNLFIAYFDLKGGAS